MGIKKALLFSFVLVSMLSTSAATIKVKSLRRKPTKTQEFKSLCTYTRKDVYEVTVKVDPAQVGNAKLCAMTVIQAVGLKKQNRTKNFYIPLKDSVKMVSLEKNITTFTFTTPTTTFYDQKSSWGNVSPVGARINGIIIYVTVDDEKKKPDFYNNSTYKHKDLAYLTKELEDPKSKPEWEGSIMLSDNSVGLSRELECVDYSTAALVEKE